MAAKDAIGSQFLNNNPKRPHVPIDWYEERGSTIYGSAPHVLPSMAHDLDIEVEHDPNVEHRRSWMANVQGKPVRYANSDIAIDEDFLTGYYSTKQRAMWAAQAAVNRHHAKDQGPRPINHDDWTSWDVQDRIKAGREKRAADATAKADAAAKEKKAAEKKAGRIEAAKPKKNTQGSTVGVGRTIKTTKKG